MTTATEAKETPILTLGSLFAGIGGIDLGFERAGFTTTWQVEINPYCRKVLEKNFPHAERYTDIRECGAHNLKPVDVIGGGFPCQDISNAGKRAGIDGERSGLWREMHRIIGEIRPEYVLVENVAALLGRGISRVLGDLSEIGYDAEWQVISAADVGAPHLRERIWIVAYDTSLGCGAGRTWGFDSGSARESEQPLSMANPANSGEDVCNAASSGLQDRTGETPGQSRTIAQFERSDCEISDAYGHHAQRIFTGSLDSQERSFTSERPSGSCHSGAAGQWAVEPNVGRVAHGVPARVDRLRALGNSVVPQIPELIARRIRELLEQETALSFRKVEGI